MTCPYGFVKAVQSAIAAAIELFALFFISDHNIVPNCQRSLSVSVEKK
jgi:hypothetical protein